MGWASYALLEPAALGHAWAVDLGRLKNGLDWISGRKLKLWPDLSQTYYALSLVLMFQKKKKIKKSINK